MELKKGNLYRVHSRNLDLAVYNGSGRFVGIRNKFNTRFLDSELFWDEGGTLKPLEDLGPIPKEIEPVEGWWDKEAEQGKRWKPNTKLFNYLNRKESNEKIF